MNGRGGPWVESGRGQATDSLAGRLQCATTCVEAAAVTVEVLASGARRNADTLFSVYRGLLEQVTVAHSHATKIATRGKSPNHSPTQIRAQVSKIYMMPGASVLPQNGLRALLVPDRQAASAQGRVGDFPSTWIGKATSDGIDLTIVL